MSHYYDKDQESKLIISEITCSALGKQFSFFTSSATFSKRGLDKGTKTLIEHAQIKPESKVLDLGCGWGPIGIILLLEHKTIDMTMSDVNKRALFIARKNATKHNVSPYIKYSHTFEKIKDTDFDTILTNPPYAAGRQLCYKFIEESYAHLKINGNLQLVARHQKGGAMLEKKMKEIFGNVQTLAKKGGFRLYMSTKAP